MMAIVKIDPADWEKYNAVQLDSDAASEPDARREIEAWADEHLFAVAADGWLRPILYADGRWVHRGVCYRLMEEITPTQAGRATVGLEVAAGSSSALVSESRTGGVR